jgi:hypothetical protein
MRRHFVRPLSDEEREEMARVYRSSTTADLVRRCHAVLLSADGHPLPALAQRLRVDQSVIACDSRHDATHLESFIQNASGCSLAAGLESKPISHGRPAPAAAGAGIDLMSWLILTA